MDTSVIFEVGEYFIENILEIKQKNSVIYFGNINNTDKTNDELKMPELVDVSTGYYGDPVGIGAV